MTARCVYCLCRRLLLLVNRNTWGYVSSSEDLKRTIWGVIVGIVIVIVGVVSASIAAGVGNYIIQALNRSGFTIPASANYVAPIESLPSSVFLVVRAGSSARLVIAIILAAVLVGGTIAVLWKRYGGLTA